MGLFDRAFGGQEASSTLNKYEAFAGILLAAVACDGHISDDEVQVLNTITSRMRLFESVEGPKFKKMIDRLFGILKREGHEKLLERCTEALPEELSDTAFASACDLVLADQGIEDDEKEFLSNLQVRLGVDRDQSLKIFRVMVIKNRG
jgi:hypothetical protein